jgi:TolA-binding protein
MIQNLFLRVGLISVILFSAAQAATTQPADDSVVSKEQRAKLVQTAHDRMAADRKKHTREELQDAEKLYQVANADWRSDKARESLAKMIEKYPDMDRTGCAVLYLGQMADGKDRAMYLTQAVEKFSDCYYGNGVQVGGWARLLLGLYYQDNGNPDKAKALFDEIRKDYANAIDHQGHLLVNLIPTKQ